MKNTRKQSFIHGAAILAAAGIGVKILGAFYKIPLGAILGPVGMADFSISYSIYALLFTFSTAGIPAAVSKLIAERSGKGNHNEILAVYKTAMYAFVAVGFLCFTLMFFGAEQIATIMGSKSAVYSIKAISPAVLFVSISAVTRGYFQGRSNMLPTAISELIEAAGKMLAGLAIGIYLKKRGCGEAIISAGAVFGVSIGALLSATYFMFCRDKAVHANHQAKINWFGIIKELLSLAIPITMGSAVISLTNVIDSALVMNMLVGNGFSELRSKWLYGAYSYATTLFNLPSVLVTTLAISLLPTLSEAKAKKDMIRLDKCVNMGISIAAMTAVPIACGLCALSQDVMNFLFDSSIERECIELSGKLLSVLCAAIPALALVTVTNSVHQAMGKANITVVSMVIGATAKLISNYFLIGKTDLNIFGACVSTVICYYIIAFLNIISLKKYSFIEVKLIKIMVNPMVIGAIAYFSSLWAKNTFTRMFNDKISLILSIIVGFCACVMMAFCVGIFEKNKIRAVFGEKIIFKFIDND